jgi:hypothetical protein
MAKLGGVCSILTGAIFFVSGLIFFLQTGQFDWYSIGSISRYLQAVPYGATLWVLGNWGAALAAFLAIAGVLALSDALRLVHAGLVRWTSTLAIIGYAILAVSNVADLYQIQRMVAIYPQLDPSARSALEAMGSGSLDPNQGLWYITISPWLMAAGWTSYRGSQLPKNCWLGSGSSPVWQHFCSWRSLYSGSRRSR